MHSTHFRAEVPPPLRQRELTAGPTMEPALQGPDTGPALQQGPDTGPAGGSPAPD